MPTLDWRGEDTSYIILIWCPGFGQPVLKLWKPKWRFSFYEQWNMNLEHLWSCYILSIGISTLLQIHFFPASFNADWNSNSPSLKSQSMLVSKVSQKVQEGILSFKQKLCKKPGSVCSCWWEGNGELTLHGSMPRPSAALHDSSLQSLPLSSRPLPWTLTTAPMNPSLNK